MSGLFEHEIFNIPAVVDERLFRDFFNLSPRAKALEPGTYTIDLPGVKKEDLKVTLEGDRAKVEWTRGGTKGQAIYALQEGTEEIKAKLDLGVLTLTVVAPERKQSKGKSVPVE